MAWLTPITGKRKDIFCLSSTSRVMTIKERFSFSGKEENLQRKKKTNQEMGKDAGKGIGFDEARNGDTNDTDYGGNVKKEENIVTENETARREDE